jgi:hypothetical protein
MRQLFLFVAVVIFLGGMTGCKKQIAKMSQIKTIEYIINDCGNKAGNPSNDFEICFTRLITECRCPLGGVCIWAGYAECEFSIKKNNQTSIFKLATLDNTQFHSDIEIYGIKIKLENVLPYPDFTQPSTEPTKAILKIEY